MPGMCLGLGAAELDHAKSITVFAQSSTGQTGSERELLRYSFVHSFIYLIPQHLLCVELDVSCQGIKAMGPGSSKRNVILC